jgi:glycosyltransferase involved in cell wall biosynthesis
MAEDALPHRMTRNESTPLEVTVVMPCLNEADTLATCIRKALAAMRNAGIAGEVVVADNGSTDGSLAIAIAEGARLVQVADRGYGAALMGGIEAAHGKFVIMGDADDSYDFGEVPTFVARLREGYDLVQGCRLESGGGRLLPGAMPFLHRWLGNPMFSRTARRWFRAPVHDIYCGLRGFTKTLYQALDPVHRNGVRHRDDHQRGCSASRAPRFPVPRALAARVTRRISRPSATAGERCAFS